MKKCGPTVACTITAHHLALTVDDWAGQSWHFCKPVAKYPDDRRALQEIVKQGQLPHEFKQYKLNGSPKAIQGFSLDLIQLHIRRKRSRQAHQHMHVLLVYILLLSYFL